MATSPYKPVFHYLSLLTCAATLALIGMGGLVTSHHAGMSVPDWPNSYGYNMFLFPPNRWVGGIFYEHTHRLMGTVVGMLSIALVAAAWLLESRRWVRILAATVLGAVICEGVLGGLRVVYNSLDLAPLHGCVAQTIFCTTIAMSVVTSRWWISAPDLSKSPLAKGGRRIMALAAVAFGVIFLQLIVGACMRHFGAGLAIPDLPKAYGHWLPPVNDAQLAAANHQRAWMPTPAGSTPLDPVTLGQIWLHFAHRVGAVLVTLAILALFGMIVLHRQNFGLLLPAIVLLVLLTAQAILGVLTVFLRKPADIATLHVMVGALTLAFTALIWLRSARLYAIHGRRLRFRAASLVPSRDLIEMRMNFT